MAQPTLTTRVTHLEAEQQANRRDIDNTQSDISALDGKMDTVILKVATFETEFTDFLNNGLPQRIGDYLAKKGKERNSRWRMFLFVLAGVVSVGSLAVAIAVLVRGG